MIGLVQSENVGEGATVIRLNRASKANALNRELVETLHESLDKELASGKRLIMFVGVGEHFCSGFDFAGYQNSSQAELAYRFIQIERLLAKIRFAPCLTVAVVQGAAFGAGADLVTSCTIRVGKEGCRFRFPGLRFGVVLGTRYLSRIVGLTVARRILLSGKELSGPDALECGLLTELEKDGVADVAILRKIADEVPATALDTARIVNEIDYSKEEMLSDLGQLVESVAEPGLHERIGRYLGKRKLKH